MESLLNGMFAFFNQVQKILVGMTKSLHTFFLAVWALVILVVALWTNFFNGVGALIARAVGYLDSMFDSAVVGIQAARVTIGPLTQTLQLANTVFPVQEALGLLVILGLVWVVGISYRFLKSWVPTLS